MNLLTNIHLLQEAYAVMHNIPVERQYSDRELGPALVEIEEAERELDHQYMAAHAATENEDE